MIETLASQASALMGVELWALALICVLVFLAGYVDSIAGGGGFVSLPAYLIAGLPTHAALATNKLSSTMGTAVATWHYARSGFIDIRLALLSVACALVGSTFGSNLMLMVDESALRIILLVVIPVSATYVLRAKALGARPGGGRPLRQTILCCLVIAFVIGVYDGFYGPGTGTFLMLLFGGLAKLRLDEAVGLTKAVNLSTNAAALAVFLLHGQTLVVLGLIAGAFSIAGNYLGAHTYTKSGGFLARPLTLIVLAVFMVRTIYDVVVSGM